jgi:hypothetical protein
MSVDFNAIATAIATRFSSTYVTAPSGETNVRLSTSALPEAIVREPTVLVFPPSITLSYGPSLRKATASYPVRFYIYKVRDTGRNATLMNKWIGSLYAMLPDTLAHLGLSSYVTSAVATNIQVGPLTYGESGGIEYHGIELTIDVHIWEGLSATA